MNAIRLLTLIIALVFAAMGMRSPLLTIYLEQLGSSYGQISLILASSGLVGLLGNYIWGRTSDRLGRRKPLAAAGLFGTAIAHAALSLVTAPGVAWAARLAEAATFAAYSTASLAMMGDLLGAADQGNRRGARMGGYRGIGSLAFAVGAVAGGRLADVYSLRAMLAACAVLYALAGLAALALKEAPPAPRLAPDARVAARRSSRRSALPIAFLAGVFLWMAAHQGATSMWPNYMAQLGYSNTAISGLWGLAAFTEAPAMLAVGRLSDALGRAPLLVAGGLIMAVVQFGYIVLASVFIALLGIQILRGLGFASFTTSSMTFAAEQGDRETHGRNAGMFNAVGSAGQLAGFLLGGTLAQARGFTFMFGVFIAAMLLSAGCFLWLQRTQPAPPTSTTYSQ